MHFLGPSLPSSHRGRLRHNPDQGFFGGSRSRVSLGHRKAMLRHNDAGFGRGGSISILYVPRRSWRSALFSEQATLFRLVITQQGPECFLRNADASLLHSIPAADSDRATVPASGSTGRACILFLGGRLSRVRPTRGDLHRPRGRNTRPRRRRRARARRPGPSLSTASSFVVTMVFKTPSVSVTASAETIPASAPLPGPTRRAPRTVELRQGDWN